MEAGFDSIAEAARAKGLHKQNLADHEAERRGISPENAERYARAFGTTPEWILLGVDKRKATVPIIGYIGAGSEVYPYDDHAMGGGFDRIDAPPSCPLGAVAVQVRGTSQYPIYGDGDIIVYAERRPDVANFMGQRCVVGLADERIMVKTLAPGSRPGVFSLYSYNAPPIPDVVVEWCARILWVRPRQ